MIVIILPIIFISITGDNNKTEKLFELSIRFVASGTIDDYNIREIKNYLATRFEYNIENIIVEIVPASVIIIVRFISATEKNKRDVKTFSEDVGLVENAFNTKIESSISFQVDHEIGTLSPPLFIQWLEILKYFRVVHPLK